ncbi:MAG: hypothetical protein EBR09_08870 [Proteobacteria bacterium]|nr:hypothetical protein [Pseudomonadota bacterium]
MTTFFISGSRFEFSRFSLPKRKKSISTGGRNGSWAKMKTHSQNFHFEKSTINTGKFSGIAI